MLDIRDGVAKNYNERQKNSLESLILAFQNKTNKTVQVDKKKYVERNVSKKTPFQTILNKLNEIKVYVSNKDIKIIGTKGKFSDGTSIEAWWDRINSEKFLKSLSDDEKRIVDKEIFEIGELLYADDKYNLNENSSISYGPILYRIMLNFNYDFSQIFNELRIPKSIFVSIGNNVVYPSKDIVEKILNWLESLDRKVVYSFQRENLNEAIAIYRSLLKDVLNKKEEKIQFQLFDLDKLNEYEDAIVGVDKDVVARVKRSNFDWYVKCVTYFYIYTQLKMTPNQNMYFYDGSIIHKWYPTQVRAIEKVVSYNITEDQILMFNGIIKLRKDLEEYKKQVYNLETAMKCNFNYYFNVIKEYIEINNKLPITERIDNFRLLDIWQYCGFVYHNNASWLSDEEFEKIDDLRRYYIVVEKKKGKNQSNYAVSLRYIIEALGINIAKFAELIGVSSALITQYTSCGMIPSKETAQKITNAFTKMDKSKLRKRQIEAINQFVNITNYVVYNKPRALKKKEPKRVFVPISNSNINYGNSGELYLDVPEEIINKVKEYDMDWFNSFVGLVNVFKDYSKYYINDKNLLNRNFRLYTKLKKDETGNSLIEEQKVLLDYICYLKDRNMFDVRHQAFLENFNKLEEYVNKNGFISSGDESQKNLYQFYRSIRDRYFGNSNRYGYVTDDDLYRMKHILQNESYYIYEVTDYIEENKLYIGRNLNLLRLSLGYPLKTFIEVLGLNELGNCDYAMFDYYKNRVGINLKQLNGIKEFLVNIDKDNLRKDQLEDVNAFIELISIYEQELSKTSGYGLKLTKNNDNN